MPVIRTIENFGILKFAPEERGATNLIVQTDVIQLPYSEYVNTKSNPPKGHYGYASLMHKEYVMQVIDIQFRRQLLINENRYLIQLAWQEFCNSKTIAQQLGAPLPDTTVDYPIWFCDEIRFKLEPGVILQVFKSHISPITCSGSGIREPNLGGTPPGLPTSPAPPPPPTTPNSDRIPLSPPYEGDDDNGNTYVRGDDPPPPNGTCGRARFVGEWRFGNASGSDGPNFDILLDNVVAGSFRDEPGLSSDEVYVFYRKCGEDKDTFIGNGSGGARPGYTVTYLPPTT